MITYLATKPHTYTIERYLNTWGQPLADRFRVATYQSIVPEADFEPTAGTYIFSDLERLGPALVRVAAKAWRKIADLGGQTRILNHPTRSMRRFELLRTMFEDGINTFNAYRLVERRQPRRWPVFIRDENKHTKSLTDLLHTPDELKAAVAEMFERGDVREDKLIVEFCDIKEPDGLHYKYEALLIGDHLIPRSVRASRHWVVMRGRYEQTDAVLERARRVAESNPHEQELREIFRLARIDYGNIDYSLLGDRIQVWEINTNPNIFPPTDLQVLSSTDPADDGRKALLRRYADRVAAAFSAVEG